jgi:hypothetical protein
VSLSENVVVLIDRIRRTGVAAFAAIWAVVDWLGPGGWLLGFWEGD